MVTAVVSEHGCQDVWKYKGIGDRRAVACPDSKQFLEMPAYLEFFGCKESSEISRKM